MKQVPEKADNFMTKEDVEALYSKKMQKWLETKEEFKKKEKASKEVEKNIMNKNLLKKQGEKHAQLLDRFCVYLRVFNSLIIMFIL